MNWKGILVALLILAALSAGIAYYMWNKPHTDYENVEADYSLTANQLFDELDAEETAKAKYQDKIVEISGEVEGIEQSVDSAYIILLRADNALMGGVNAKLASSYNSSTAVSNLKEGEMLTLKCRFQGFEKDLITEVKCDN